MKKKSKAWTHLRRFALATLVSAGLLGAGGAALVFAQAVVPPSDSVQNMQPAAPVGTEAFGESNVRGNFTTSQTWRDIRQGVVGTVSIPDKKAAVLVQSEGEVWRNMRNGPLSNYGGWVLLAAVAGVAGFFALRGKIKIDSGPAGTTIRRFNGVERFGHWLTAISFIVLALTGLNTLYGRYTVKPLIGADAFGLISGLFKWLHNYVAFLFMLGTVMIFVLWVRHNLPSKEDLVWLARGGGLFSKGVHPPARKFNAGQKFIFWSVVLGAVALTWSGFLLLMPFTFGDMAAQHLSQLVHAAVALVMVAIIIGHIYIGSVGMEGALDAMKTGDVDLNWAREHHSLWVAEATGERPPTSH